MKTILLAIKPKWAEKIYSGEKTVEFRKTIPACMQPGADETVKAFLYESAPVSRITGKCFLSLGSFSPDGSFHDETLKKGCLTEQEMAGYSRGKPVYALSVTGAKVRMKWLKISDTRFKRPPQSWCYVGAV